jgi:hypothetical protein
MCSMLNISFQVEVSYNSHSSAMVAHLAAGYENAAVGYKNAVRCVVASAAGYEKPVARYENAGDNEVV